MIVVSDTSAITSLLQIGRAELLAQLYTQVVIPEAVANDLYRNHSTLPAFIKVQPVSNRQQVTRLTKQLDLGEAEAIALMLEGKGDLLLIDERAGREAAMREGLRIVGLLGVFAEAKRHGLVASLKEEIQQLETKAGFRISDALKRRILGHSGET